jgi:hypothetical protein
MAVDGAVVCCGVVGGILFIIMVIILSVQSYATLGYNEMGKGKSDMFYSLTETSDLYCSK